MEIIRETVSYDDEFLVDGKLKYSAQDMLEIIADLLETDGFFNVICFNDKEAEEYFINKKLTYQTARGSCATNEQMSKKLKKFYNKIYLMLYPNEKPVY